jgi:septal ring factor EnvC (AmiA/AmiB activator)
MAANGAEHVEQQLQEFRAEVRQRFDRVGEDLKELTKALRDLIRLDGDIRRLAEAVKRIGTQVDDHEGRLRAVEANGTAAQADTKHHDKLLWFIVIAASNVVTAILVHALTKAT